LVPVSVNCLFLDANNPVPTAESIPGDKSQEARERALKSFKNNSIRALVATDIASRGIDIDKLSHAINFEIPKDAETYVHRTGRASQNGIALSFCDKKERLYLDNIHKIVKQRIRVVQGHPYSIFGNN